MLALVRGCVLRDFDFINTDDERHHVREHHGNEQRHHYGNDERHYFIDHDRNDIEHADDIRHVEWYDESNHDHDHIPNHQCHHFAHQYCHHHRHNYAAGSHV